MIVGFLLAGLFVPVRPEITVAPERLIEEPLFTLPKPFGPFYLVNTLTTLIFTIVVLILPLAWATRNSLKKSAETDLVPRGVGNLVETILELLYNLTEGSAGKYTRMIFPWFATIMIYVLFANLLKLIPGFESIGVIHPTHSEGHGTQLLGMIGNLRVDNLLPEEGGYVL